MRQIRIIVILLLLAAPVFAITGRLQGSVKDAQGNPLPNVLIKIDATGEVHQSYTAYTNAKGQYIHIGVAPDKYRITASLDGFQPAQGYAYIDLRVTLQEPAVADFVLQKIQAAPAKQEKKEEAPAPPSDAQRGLDLVQAGKLDEGIAALQKALETNPGVATTHYNLGVALDKKKQGAEARKHFQEAVKLDPNLGPAYLALGNSYLSDQKFDAPAIEALTKATTLMPTSYPAFYNLGVCYANGGKHSEAEQAFRKAVEIDPKEPVAHYQLGMSLLGQAKNKEAKAEFQKYLELNPNAADKAEVEELLKTM